MANQELDKDYLFKTAARIMGKKCIGITFKCGNL